MASSLETMSSLTSKYCTQRVRFQRHETFLTQQAQRPGPITCKNGVKASKFTVPMYIVYMLIYAFATRNIKSIFVKKRCPGSTLQRKNTTKEEAYHASRGSEPIRARSRSHCSSDIHLPTPANFASPLMILHFNTFLPICDTLNLVPLQSPFNGSKFLSDIQP